MRSNHTAAVVGIGHSKVVRRADVPLGVLAAEAARAAVTDAGIELEAINGIAGVLGNHHGIDDTMIDGREYISAELLVRQLGLRPTWGTNNNHMVGNAFADAIWAVEAGACDYALVVRAMHSPRGTYGQSTRRDAEGLAQYIAPYGFFVPALFAHTWHRYQDKYLSGSREQMATLVVQARENGLLNPDSYWAQAGAGPLSVDEYLGARTVSTPLSIFDCDLPVQGAGAFVVTRATKSSTAGHRRAYIHGLASPEPKAQADAGFLLLEGEQEAARHVGELLWADAGLSPLDIDVASLYDGFSPMIIQWLEGLGFAEQGEGFDFVQEGRTRRDGMLPLNTGGGNLGAGRMHGVPQLMEAVRQVTGRAGPAQVDGAELALAAIGPTSLGAAVILGSEPPS